MKKILTLAILLWFSATAAMSQVADGRVKISGLKIEDRGETVKVGFTATVAPDAVKRNHSLVFIPVIAGSGYRQSLSPVVVQGKGSKTARARREWVAGRTATYENAVHTTNGQTVTVSAEVPFQQWMSGAELAFESVEGGCCTYGRLSDTVFAENIVVRRAAEPILVPDSEPVWVPVSVADSLSTAFTFVVPVSEFDPEDPFKIYDYERESSLIVYFRLAKYDIDASYMDNAHTLKNLTAAIDMIMDSKDSRVERIVVAGFASPEGSFEFNDRLAFERAVSVKRHLMETTEAQDNQITVFNGSVDWRGLRDMVAQSDLPEKQEILSVIDNTPVWDSQRQTGRLGELMRLNGGKTYRYLLDEYFPYLRNGAFIRVYYENK